MTRSPGAASAGGGRARCARGRRPAPPSEHRLGAWPRSPRGRATRASSSRRSARPTTASRACSRSGRTRAGARFLVSRVPADAARVLDVATGTGRSRSSSRGACRRVTSSASTRARRCSPPGARASRAPARRADRAREARAEALPFADAAFDPLTFTYLLRYVDDPAATLRELARVVRPGGTIAMLEFGRAARLWRPLWELYVRVGLPGAGRLVSPGVARGRPLPRADHPRLLRARTRSRAARALARRGHRGRPARRLSLGGGIVIWGTRAREQRRRGRRSTRCAPGGWRDYVTLLHPPYTPWHLSYVASARRSRRSWTGALLGWTVLAFFARDGRRRARARRAERPAAADADPRARARRARGRLVGGGVRDRDRRRVATRRWWLLAFVAFGAFIVVAYNLELFGGAFHSDLWFALAWGAFPVLTGVLRGGRAPARRALAAAAFASARPSRSGGSRRPCAPPGAAAAIRRRPAGRGRAAAARRRDAAARGGAASGRSG